MQRLGREGGLTFARPQLTTIKMASTGAQMSEPDEAKKDSQPADDNITPQLIPVVELSNPREDPPDLETYLQFQFEQDQQFRLQHEQQLQLQHEQDRMELDSQFSAMDAPRFIPLVNLTVWADDDQVLDHETGAQSSHINPSQGFTVNDLLRDDYDNIQDVSPMEDGSTADGLHPDQDNGSPMPPRDEHAPMVVSSDPNYIPYRPHERPMIVSSDMMNWAHNLSLPDIIDIPCTPIMHQQVAPNFIPRYHDREMIQCPDLNHPRLNFTWPSSRGYPERPDNWPLNHTAFPSRPLEPAPELGGHGDIYMGYTPQEDQSHDRIGLPSKLFIQTDPTARRLYEEDMRLRATGGASIHPSRLLAEPEPEPEPEPEELSFYLPPELLMTANELSFFGSDQDWLQNYPYPMPFGTLFGMPAGMATAALPLPYGQANWSVPPQDVPMQSVEQQQSSQVLQSIEDQQPSQSQQPNLPAQQPSSPSTTLLPVTTARVLGTKTRTPCSADSESSEEDDEAITGRGDDGDDDVDWKPRKSGARKKKTPAAARRAATSASGTAPVGPTTSAPLAAPAGAQPSAEPSAGAPRKKLPRPRKPAAPKNPAAPRKQGPRKKAQNKAAAETQDDADEDNDLGPSSSQTVAAGDDPAATAPQPAKPPRKKRAPPKKKAVANAAASVSSANSELSVPEPRPRGPKGWRGSYKRRPKKDAEEAMAEARKRAGLPPLAGDASLTNTTTTGPGPGASDLMVFTSYAPGPGPGPNPGPRAPQQGQQRVPSAGQLEAGLFHPNMTVEEHQRRVPEFAAAVQQHSPPALHFPGGRPHHNAPRHGGHQQHGGQGTHHNNPQYSEQDVRYNNPQQGGQRMHHNDYQQGGQMMHHQPPQQGGQGMYRNPPQQGGQRMHHDDYQQGGQRMHYQPPQQGGQGMYRNPPQQGSHRMPHDPRNVGQRTLYDPFQQGPQREPYISPQQNPPQQGGQKIQILQRPGVVNQHISPPSTSRTRQTELSPSPMGRYPNLSPAHFRAPLPEVLERQLYDTWRPESEPNSPPGFPTPSKMSYRRQAEYESSNDFLRSRHAMERDGVDFDVNFQLMRRQREGHQPGDVGLPLTEEQLRMHDENNRHIEEFEQRTGNSYPRVNSIQEQAANANRPPESWLPPQSRAALHARMLPPPVPASRMRASTAAVEAEQDEDEDEEVVQAAPTKKKRKSKAQVKAEAEEKARKEALDAEAAGHQPSTQEQGLPPVQTPYLAAQAASATMPVLALPEPAQAPKKQPAKRQPAKKRNSAAADLGDEKQKQDTTTSISTPTTPTTFTPSDTFTASTFSTAANTSTAADTFTASAFSTAAADTSTIVVATTLPGPSAAAAASLFSGQTSPMTSLFPFAGGPYAAAEASRRARETTPTPAPAQGGGAGAQQLPPGWRYDETWGAFRERRDGEGGEQ